MPPLQHGDQYAWSYSLKAVDGGLIKTKDQYPFLAPATGYQPEVSYRSYSTRSGGESTTERFYLSSRSGKVYAMIEAEWIPEGCNYGLSILVNKTGSRVLEPGMETRKEIQNR
jgi:hypothetical protein